MSIVEADICVIGAGAGGLVVAAAAAQLGARTVLVERGRMGGNRLHTGGVPSTALLAAGHAAQAVRNAARFGIGVRELEIDFAAVMAHVRDTIAAVEPNDSVERFAGLGVEVIAAAGRFTGRDTLAAGQQIVRARRFVIATGSRPAVPPIPGLDAVPYLTSDTLWSLRERADHLVVLGGGPTGLETAQAFRRLGSAVTILEAERVLRRDDPEIASLLRERLTAEGIEIHEGAAVQAVGRTGPGVAVRLATGAVEGSHLLVATGRRPAIEALGLESAGVAVADGQVTVDARLRTTNSHILAIGDVTGGSGLAHVAGWQAGLAIRSLLFRAPITAVGTVPHVTYTDPELAHVGLTEADARRRGIAFDVLRSPFADNHRAQAERRTEGLIKAVVGPRGRILGATILGPSAGDLILPWVMAIRQKLGLDAMAGLVVPYPTRSEVSRSVTTGWLAPRLLSPRMRGIVRLLQRLG